jgi:PAS domain S-box-containing protein
VVGYQHDARRTGSWQQSAMAEGTRILIWQSGPDKRSTYFNEAWLDFTGRTPGQEAGRGWAEGVHPDDVERCLETYARAFDARQDFEMEYRLRRHDGEYRWVLDRGTQLRGDDAAFLGYIGGCIDITDRKLLDGQEAEQLLADARRSIADELRDYAAQTAFVKRLTASAGVVELGRLVRCFEQRTGIQADLVLTGLAGVALPTDLAGALEAVGRAALANVEQHSQVSAVVLGLRVGPRGVTLSIQDDGVGVAPGAVARNLSQRVRRLGGTLVARPLPDGGFVVRLRLPLPAPAGGVHGCTYTTEPTLRNAQANCASA